MTLDASSLSTVRRAIRAICLFSDTAIVKPSRLLTCSMTWTSELPSPTYTYGRARCPARLELLEDGHLAVAGRDARDRSHLAGVDVVLELGAEDVIGRDDARERRLDHFPGAAEITKKEKRWPSSPARAVDERRDVLRSRTAPPGLLEVLAPHAAELGIVTNQVGQLAALLHQVVAGQPLDLVLERRGADQLAQDHARSLKLSVWSKSEATRKCFGEVGVMCAWPLSQLAKSGISD